MLLLSLSWRAGEACKLSCVRNALLSIQPQFSAWSRGTATPVWEERPLQEMAVSCNTQAYHSKCLWLLRSRQVHSAGSTASAQMFLSPLSFLINRTGQNMGQPQSPESRWKLLSSLYYSCKSLQNYFNITNKTKPLFPPFKNYAFARLLHVTP